MVEEREDNGTDAREEIEAAVPVETPESEGLPAEEEETFVSAKDIPRPGTRLASPPVKPIGELSVSLMDVSAPWVDLDAVTEFNADDDSETRTPLLSVLEALLQRNGRPMAIGELAEEAVKLWNRPLPTTPYDLEQFIYLVAQGSDRLKVHD